MSEKIDAKVGLNGERYQLPSEGIYSPEGLKFSRTFVPEGVNPFRYDISTGKELEWDYRTPEIKDDKGKIIFRQENVEVPKNWSMLATNVASSKYLYGDNDVENARESSMSSLVDRVARTITTWGVKDGYFASQDDAQNFYDQLVGLTINQHGAFNSPVWFNFGLYQEYGVGKDSAEGNYFYDKKTGEIKKATNQYEYPQGSACFIQHVDDTMESILDLARSEAMLFKFGSGTGTDLSTLRSTYEKMSGGGKPSGPLSFLEVYDAIAGVIKSGGKTRRAAKMNTLKDWHPDIKSFIEAKPKEERKAHALIEQGYSGDFNGEAYGSVMFQNENLSVRVTDEFMKAVEEDKEWKTHWVTDPTKEGPTYKARDLMKEIAEGTWFCGDPGLQYEDTIQKWHTCKADGPINSSNPCSEYMFLDDTACNLASLNLKKFVGKDGKFDTEKFQEAVKIFITAQDIIVDNASYPTQKIARNSHIYRTLGLGYANLGGFLMSEGLAYDSEQGRETAAAITALMHDTAYIQSSEIAKTKGTFEGYERNKKSMLEVISMHNEATQKIDDSKIPENLRNISAAAKKAGLEMVLDGEKYGFKNAQVTVLAPTGTIGFMMDADTTGIEPDTALVKYKLLAGGGNLKIVNQSVGPALERMGYSEEERKKILEHIDNTDTIEGAPGLKKEHLSIFDCAFKPRNGERSIHYTGHLKMMSAVQPFLSGAISKTVNIPTNATPEEIAETYKLGHELGLKAVAIYRDGCKKSQPVSTGKREEKENKLEQAVRPARRKMPDTRDSVTHKFDIAGHEGYVTVGMYEDGTPGEMFIVMAKEGSTIGGLMDAFGTAISLGLQYGVPVEKVVEKFSHQRFEPSGFTKNPNIQIAKSIPDYIFRWFGQEFLEKKESEKIVQESQQPIQVNGNGIDNKKKEGGKTFQNQSDAPPCDNCGSITVRNGACFKCDNCGNSMGCS